MWWVTIKKKLDNFQISDEYYKIVAYNGKIPLILSSFFIYGLQSFYIDDQRIFIEHFPSLDDKWFILLCGHLLLRPSAC